MSAKPTRPIPPHANAAVHRKIMKALEAMSATERRETLVSAGVLTKSGKLAKAYKQEATLSYREPLASPAAE